MTKKFRVTYKVIKMYEADVEADTKEEASIKVSHLFYTEDKENYFKGFDFEQEVFELNCDGDVLNA